MSMISQTATNGQSINSLSPYPNGNRAFGIDESQKQNAFDIWGAITRRKFIIILACIVGGVIGYLNFTKEKPAYSSWLKLMIWEQAPPSVLDGEWIQRRVAVTKHQNLLGSELVLSSAVENGGLEKLSTFSGTVSPVSLLKGMLRISSVSTNDDTLTLTCNGPVAEDLPVILEQVVNAYQRVLADESKNVGQESIAIFEKLQKKLLKEKKEAEDRYLELSKILGPIASTSSQVVTNPHLEEMQRLEAEKRSLAQQLKETEQKLRLFRQLDESPSQSMKELAVIEANRYLNLQISSEAETEATRSDFLLRRIAEFDDLVTQRQLQRQSVGPSVGPSHPSIAAIDSEVKYLQWQIANMKKELDGIAASESNAEEASVSVAEQRAERQLELYRTALTLEEKQVVDAIEQIQKRIEAEESLAAQVAGAVVECNLLRDRIEEKRNEIQVVFDRLSEIDLVSSDYNTVRVRTIDSPNVGRQVSPVMSKAMGYPIFIAGLIGVGLSLLIDRLDMTFRTSMEIAENLGVPVVGTIPRIRGKNPANFEGSAILAAAHSPRSRISEAFRAVRTGLFFASEHGLKKCFLFTSPSPGDGKSTVTSNLAISIAQTGKKVCLVDADFRRPTISKLFDFPSDEGILDVMNGDCTLTEAVTQSLQDNLFVLGTGGSCDTPGEVVTAPEFELIIEELQKEFDYVLIDSPPIGPVADANVISRMVDAVYLVLRIRKGIRVSAATAVDNLNQVEADLKGIIVNDVDENPHYSDYGYQYAAYNGYGRYNYGYGGYGYGSQRITEKPSPATAGKSR